MSELVTFGPDAKCSVWRTNSRCPGRSEKRQEPTLIEQSVRQDWAAKTIRGALLSQEICYSFSPEPGIQPSRDLSA